jgi:HSP20 family molecular chaperone IbpA
MFESKKCKNCGEKMKDEWGFCPFCGEETPTSGINPFESVFEDVEDEFKRIDKMFGSDFFKIPNLDMKMPRGSNGVSIIITSGDGKPKIQVRTSKGLKNLEPEIKRNLGVKPIEEKPSRRISKITEPETDIKTSGNKQIIQIKLPEVKSFNDIEVKKLEQSLEIKAFAKDKTYFKLIPIPSNSEIANKEFKGNVLKIEIER